MPLKELRINEAWHQADLEPAYFTRGSITGALEHQKNDRASSTIRKLRFYGLQFVFLLRLTNTQGRSGEVCKLRYCCKFVRRLQPFTGCG